MNRHLADELILRMAHDLRIVQRETRDQPLGACLRAQTAQAHRDPLCHHRSPLDRYELLLGADAQDASAPSSDSCQLAAKPVSIPRSIMNMTLLSSVRKATSPVLRMIRSTSSSKSTASWMAFAGSMT